MTGMFNATALNNFTLRFDLVFPVSINIFLFFITIWILISLIHYGITNGKWRQVQLNKADKLNGGLVYSSVILLTVFCLIRYIVSAIHMTIGFRENEDCLCNAFDDITTCFYSAVLFTSYIFLWLRQRAFYTNKMLNFTYSKCLRIFSFACIFLLFASAFSAMVFVILPNNHFPTPNGCIYKPSNDDNRLQYLIALVLVVVVGQTTLLGLFVYALKPQDWKWIKLFRSSENAKHVKNTEIAVITQTNETHTSLQSVDQINSYVNVRALKNKQQNKQEKISKTKCVIRKTLKKTLLFAIISIATDIFLQLLINIIVEGNQHRRYVAMAISMNAFVTLLLVIFSFVSWKEMLTSPCRTRCSSE